MAKAKWTYLWCSTALKIDSSPSPTSIKKDRRCRRRWRRPSSSRRITVIASSQKKKKKRECKKTDDDGSIGKDIWKGDAFFSLEEREKVLYSCPVWVVAYLQEAAKMCRSFVVWRMMMRRRGREIQSVKRIRIQSTAGNFDRAWLPLRSRTQCSAVQYSTPDIISQQQHSLFRLLFINPKRRKREEKKREEKRSETLPERNKIESEALTRSRNCRTAAHRVVGLHRRRRRRGLRVVDEAVKIAHYRFTLFYQFPLIFSRWLPIASSCSFQDGEHQVVLGPSATDIGPRSRRWSSDSDGPAM